MTITFEAISQITIEDAESTTPSITGVVVGLKANKEFSIEKSFKDDQGDWNANGCLTMSQGFTQGLIACIHAAHQKGFRDSAEHLRSIISDLEQGFIKPVTVKSKVELKKL